MTRGIAETRRRLVEWPLKYDAHTWPRSADRRTLRPTGRGEYGYNRVQEIVSGTGVNRRIPIEVDGAKLVSFLPETDSNTQQAQSS